jgi:hypothetical protein
LHSSIKKYWLLLSIVYFGSQLIDAFLGNPSMDFELGLFYITLLIPFGYLFIEISNFIALYFFSYVKHGTVLLTLNMGLSILRALVVAFPFWFWKEIVAMYADNPDKNLLSDTLISCVYFLIIVQWFVFSFMLRKENILIKKKNEMLADPESQRLIQELRIASNLDELSLKYGESVRTRPQNASAFKKIFQQREIELSLPN